MHIQSVPDIDDFPGFVTIILMPTPTGLDTRYIVCKDFMTSDLLLFLGAYIKRATLSSLDGTASTN